MSFHYSSPNKNGKSTGSVKQDSSETASGENNNSNTNTTNDIYSNSSLLEQLIYVETFMPELDSPANTGTSHANTNQIEDELSSFVDNSFIFTDEDKPKFGGLSPGDNGKSPMNPDELSHHSSANNFNNNPSNKSNGLNDFNNNSDNKPNLSNSFNNNISNNNSDKLSGHFSEKVHVPIGAKQSLVNAGLSDEQINLLASLVSQRQNDQKQNINIEHPPEITPQNNLNLSPFSAFDNISSTSSPTLSNSLYLNENYAQPLNTAINNTGYLPSTSSSTSNITTPSQLFSTAQSNDSTNYNGSFTPNVSNSGNQTNVDTDKRRRNTAASARFRIKKKMKEQKLERDVKNLKEVAASLELRIKNLTMENNLLKNLIVEKNNRKSLEEVENMKKKALSSFAENS